MTKTSGTLSASASFAIDLCDVDQEDFAAFCTRFKIDPKKIPTLKFEAMPVEVDPDSLDDDELAAEYESRRAAGSWLHRVYRLLAENDCEAAMDELHRQFSPFGLAPPSHERAIVDRITGYKDFFHAKS